MAAATDGKSDSKDATVRLRVRYPADAFDSGLKDIPLITDAKDGVEVPAKSEDRLRELAKQNGVSVEKVG